ncbi:MAG: hypothetical protein ACXWFB_12755, partial [Nitrososphaeraceae archaeon]
MLTNGIEECKKTISDLRKEKAKLIDEHKETLMKSDKENSTRINDLNKALSGKIEELEKLKGRKFSIDRELEISNQKCSSLQKRLDSADESNRTLVSQKQELLRKNSSLDNEVLSLRRANEEYLIEIETLEALLDAKTEGLDLLNTT